MAGKKLQGDRRKLDNKSAVAAAVLEKTQLTQAEYDLLMDQGAEVDARFFDFGRTDELSDVRPRIIKEAIRPKTAVIW
jgi:hypothetical protein